MLSGSQTLMLAAAVIGTAAVGYVGYRAVQTPPVVVQPRQAAVTPAPETRAPAVPPDAPKPAAAPAPEPSFDVVRVEPSGEAVVAGRAAPKARITLLDGEKVLAQTEADPAGQFAMVPPVLPPGDHLLSLHAQGEGAESRSKQSVAISVPPKSTDKAIAAVTEPDKPTKILSDASSGVQLAPGSVAIRTAEAGEDGAFFASGLGPSGATVRLYLNDSFVADVKTAQDGAWTLRVDKGMSPGHYDVRADIVDPGGKVTSRAQVPFDYPQAGLSAARPATPEVASAKVESGPGVAVVPEVQSVTVVRGDSLWRISRKIFGAGQRYTQIYEANNAQIRDPNRIWPGQVLITPQAATQ